MAPVVQELTLTITEATSTFVTVFPVGSDQARTTVNYVTQTLTYPTTTIVVVDIASTPTSTPSNSPDAQGGLTGPEKGAIAGSILGFFLILILLYCCCWCGSSSSQSSHGGIRTRQTSPKPHKSEKSSIGGYLPPDLEVLEVQPTSISNVNVGSNKFFTKPNQPVAEIAPRSVPTRPVDKTVQIVDAGNQPSGRNYKETTTKKNSQPSTGAPAPNNDNASSKTEPSLKREQPPEKETPSKTPQHHNHHESYPLLNEAQKLRELTFRLSWNRCLRQATDDMAKLIRTGHWSAKDLKFGEDRHFRIARNRYLPGLWYERSANVGDRSQKTLLYVQQLLGADRVNPDLPPQEVPFHLSELSSLTE
ncbi:hypothetical protein PENSUB_9155 [Penicillium subrubescens]|uniref:Uncharacterized protein n=1 Tax=Penicillium subrubescens TaxID=1316194 RepID=A0A1Q5TE45_9EURO|nr:hypothetical protein PENSUB_9155 [Penicillium subrubescens]